MTVRDSLAVIRERWILVLVAVVLAVCGAGMVWSLRPAQYTATIDFYVSARTSDNTQTAYQGSLLSQERVKSYAELVQSTRVSDGVIARLGLRATPEHVAGQVTASSQTDSVIIHVAVTDPSPTRAAAMADAVGAVFTGIVADFEQPATPGAAAPVAVHVIRAASIPTSPSTPGLPLMLALGLLTGIVLGIGAALATNVLDVSIKSPDQLRQVAGAPNLATIAFDPAVRTRPLAVHDGPQSPRAEAFRQLRTNLRFLDVDNPHRIIALTSPLPSEGKTTTVLNLAAALAADGQRVLVIDADLRRPSAARLLGLEGGIGLTSVLAGQMPVAQAIQPWSEGMDLLASGPLPPNPSELLASHHMRRVIDEVRPRYDFVLIDTPPLLPVTDAAALAPLTDGVILVARYRRTSIEEVRGAAEAIGAVDVPVLGTVLCMVPTSGPRAYARYNARYEPSDSTAAATMSSHGRHAEARSRNAASGRSDPAAGMRTAPVAWVVPQARSEFRPQRHPHRATSASAAGNGVRVPADGR